MIIFYTIFIVFIICHCKFGDCVAQLSCSEKNNHNNHKNNNKVVFLHVFKCGGSTIRRILRSYSKLCTVSLATLTECNFNTKEIKSSRNGDVFPCKLKDFYLPSNPDFVSERVVLKSSDKSSIIRNPHINFMNKFDIIQGHVHYDMKGLPPIDTTSYITWLRNPLSMLISASMYVLSEEIDGMSETSLYNKIFDDLEKRVVSPKHVVGSEKIYSMYAYYFLNESSTDLQYTKSKTIINKIINNINKFQTIGILENQQVSIAMLRMLIDTNNDMNPQFWKSATKVQSNTQQSNSKHNITSSSVVSTLKASRGTLWKKIIRCLEPEYQIYEYALDLHINYCKQLLKTESERFSEFIIYSSSSHNHDKTGQNADLCMDALNKLPRYTQLTSQNKK